MNNFEELGLAAPILRALAESGYTTPTPIQAQAIPLVRTGRDLLGIAQTGTGKTAAFALPILDRLSAEGGRPPRGGCRALVLAPTRELAAQIAESFRTYGKHLGLSVAVIFGGVGYGPQRHALAGGIDILVATPGRLEDLIGERSARLDKANILVLDEADQMLDKGFLPAIRRLVRLLPNAPTRQTLFFSATMPTEIGTLAREILTDPDRVAVAPVASTAERVAQRALLVEQNGKRALLAEVLRAPGVGRALVFSRTKHGADRIVKQLEQDGLAASAIHGNKSQNQRERSLAAFKDGTAPILVATDIAARGIDIDDVTHVVQYDMPDVPETYVHRIGRTARAGASGEAVALIGPEDLDSLKAVEKLTRQDIPRQDRREDQSKPMKAVALAPRGGRGQQQRGPRPQQNAGPTRAGGGGKPQPAQAPRGGPPGAAARGADASRRRAAEAPRRDRGWAGGDFRDAPRRQGGR
jgi:ATP-dependent RNA helicase RhlE